MDDEKHDLEKNKLTTEEFLKLSPRSRALTHSQSVPDLHHISNSNKQDNYYNEQMQYLRKIITADIPVVEKPISCKLCPHKYHCVQNAIMKGFFRTFAAAFIFKSSLQFFTHLLSGRILSRSGFDLLKTRQIFSSTDSILFAQFVGLMSFTYKAILCILRRTLKTDNYSHKTLAGFIAALWICIEHKSRRRTLAMYCLIRALSDLLTLAVEYRKLPSIAHTDITIFTCSQLFVMYAFLHAPKTLDRKYYKWIRNMGNMTEQRLQFTVRSRIDPQSMYRLPCEQWWPCFPVYHSHRSCLIYNVKDWFAGLIRASKIYFPVHFLPMILFQPKLVINHPLEFARRKLFNVLISSIFLSSYQFNMKYTLCLARNYFHTDHYSHGILGGFFCGLTLFLENPKRRTEIMLYCVPRSIEVIFRLFSKEKFPIIFHVLRQPYLHIVSFQIAMAIWLTVMAIPKGRTTSNTINMTVLKTIFGSNH